MVNSVTTLMNEHMDKIGVIQILRSKRTSSARRARRVCPEEGFWREGCVQWPACSKARHLGWHHVHTLLALRALLVLLLLKFCVIPILSIFIHHCCGVVDHLVVQLRFRRCCPIVKCPKTVSVTCPRTLIERCLRSHVERCPHTFSERCLTSH